MKLFDVCSLALAVSAGVGTACHKPQPPQGPRPGESADLVFAGGDIWTMDAAHPHVTALAVRAGKIVALGTDRDVAAWIGPSTRTVALAGRAVTPGLIDAHCHLYGLGMDLENISVRDATSEADAVALVAASEQLKNWRLHTWLVGRGWDQNRWPGGAFPSKKSLDSVLPPFSLSRPLLPILLRRVDGHAIWVNSDALRIAGITKDTPDVPGGKIIRDANGEPTGVFVDNAVDLIEAHLPKPDAATRTARIVNASKVAVSLGLTGVHEMGIDDETAATYRELAKTGQLPLHVHAFLAGNPKTASELAKNAPAAPVGRFAMPGVKFFADGALGSRGARLYADYNDDHGNLGLWVTEPSELTRAVNAAVDGGWQVAVHAIGDAGVGATLDAFAAARSTHRSGPANVIKLRIEHAQVVAPADVKRMVATRAIASMQPTHATSDMPWAEKRVGASRIKGAYAWRTMLENDIPLAAGSDFPVEEPAPLRGIYAAVTRQDVAGTPADGWYATQKLTLDEALAAFTIGAAFAAGAADQRGMLAVGRAADLTMYDRKLEASRQLLETKIVMTVVDGDVVFDATGAAQ